MLSKEVCFQCTYGGSSFGFKTLWRSGVAYCRKRESLYTLYVKGVPPPACPNKLEHAVHDTERNSDA